MTSKELFQEPLAVGDCVPFLHIEEDKTSFPQLGLTVSHQTMEILCKHISGKPYVPAADTIDACFVEVYLLEIPTPMMKQNIDYPELSVLSKDPRRSRGGKKGTLK